MRNREHLRRELELQFARPFPQAHGEVNEDLAELDAMVAGLIATYLGGASDRPRLDLEAHIQSCVSDLESKAPLLNDDERDYAGRWVQLGQGILSEMRAERLEPGEGW